MTSRGAIDAADIIPVIIQPFDSVIGEEETNPVDVTPTTSKCTGPIHSSPVPSRGLNHMLVASRVVKCSDPTSIGDVDVKGKPPSIDHKISKTKHVPSEDSQPVVFTQGRVVGLTKLYRFIMVLITHSNYLAFFLTLFSLISLSECSNSGHSSGSCITDNLLFFITKLLQYLEDLHIICGVAMVVCVLTLLICSCGIFWRRACWNNGYRIDQTLPCHEQEIGPPAGQNSQMPFETSYGQVIHPMQCTIHPLKYPIKELSQADTLCSPIISSSGSIFYRDGFAQLPVFVDGLSSSTTSELEEFDCQIVATPDLVEVCKRNTAEGSVKEGPHRRVTAQTETNVIPGLFMSPYSNQHSLLPYGKEDGSSVLVCEFEDNLASSPSCISFCDHVSASSLVDEGSCFTACASGNNTNYPTSLVGLPTCSKQSWFISLSPSDSSLQCGETAGISEAPKCYQVNDGLVCMGDVNQLCGGTLKSSCCNIEKGNLDEPLEFNDADQKSECSSILDSQTLDFTACVYTTKQTPISLSSVVLPTLLKQSQWFGSVPSNSFVQTGEAVATSAAEQVTNCSACIGDINVFNSNAEVNIIDEPLAFIESNSLLEIYGDELELSPSETPRKLYRSICDKVLKPFIEPYGNNC